MISGFHSLTILAVEVDVAARAYREVLGQAGQDRRDGVAFTLANVTLEVRAAPRGAGEGLAAVTFAVADLESARRLFERRGAPSAVNGDFAWIDPASSGGPRIGLAQASPEVRPPDSPDAREGVLRLDHLVVRTQDAERAAAFYGARLGLDLRLDRSNSDWGSRLLFFRCGDAVVEVAAKLGAARSEAQDELGGVAFRAPYPVAARERLAKQGLDVSPVRGGRKPGTAVFTVRSGLAGGPALIIGPAPAAAEA